MKATVIIPSRYGSSRFDGKPLAPIKGVPMIEMVYKRAAMAGSVEKVCVATDDKRIFDAVNNSGGLAVMTSGENRSGTDRVGEAAEILGLSDSDIVVNVQGDQPLLAPECLDQVVAPLVDDPTLGMSTLAFKIIDEREKTEPKDVKVVMDVNGHALYFSRSLVPFARDRGLDFDVYKHLGVYAYTTGFLKTFRSLATGRLEDLEKLEQLRALENGHRVMVVVTRHDSPEVDLPEDIKRIEEKL